MCIFRTFWYMSELCILIRSWDTVHRGSQNGRGQKGRGSEKCTTDEKVYPSQFSYMGSNKSNYLEKSRGSSGFCRIVARYHIIGIIHLIYDIDTFARYFNLWIRRIRVKFLNSSKIIFEYEEFAFFSGMLQNSSWHPPLYFTVLCLSCNTFYKGALHSTVHEWIC